MHLSCTKDSWRTEKSLSKAFVQPGKAELEGWMGRQAAYCATRDLLHGLQLHLQVQLRLVIAILCAGEIQALTSSMPVQA